MGIPNKISPLGRGVQTLPAGYIPAEFLTFTQKCYIDTDYLPQRGYSAKMTLLYPDLPSSKIYVFGGIHAGRRNLVAIHGTWERFVYYAEAYMTMGSGTGGGWGFESNKKYEFTINDIANKKANVPNKSIIFNAQDVAYWAGHVSNNGEFEETFKVGGSNATFGHESTVRHFAWSFSNPSGEIELELIPAFDTQRGEACLCDVKRHKVYYKGANLEGRVVPGFTLTQARQLSKLPATGGSLTVSLPWEAQLVITNVPAALQIAADRGWTITVQYREPEADNAYYNKYAECETVDQIKEVNPDFRNDKTSDNGWIYPLTALKDAYALMWGNNLPSASLSYVICDAPNVTKAHSAFPHMDITYFEGDWHNVTNADYLFHRDWVSKNVLTLKTTFPALSTGVSMFRGYALTKESALRVLNSIPAYTSGSHRITIGIHVDNQTDEEVIEAITKAEAKGWTITAQWNGTATAAAASTSTFGLRSPSIYAKLGTVEHPDSTTKQVLDWGHYVTNWEENGYQEFSSIEEAEEYFNINQTEEV